MPIIPSDTVRIDEREDADTPAVQARIAVATDGVDHAADPTRRDPAAVERADEQPVAYETATVETATARRPRATSPAPADPPAEPDA